MLSGMDSPGFGKLVIGIGNDFRGDDSAGHLVARRLVAQNLSGVTIVESDGDSATLIEFWKGTDLTIAVDAVFSGEKPGKIYRFEPITETIPQKLFSKSSTHDFGLIEAIELSRVLGSFPKRMIVYGIVGAAFEPGSSISEDVALAVQEIVKLVYNDLSFGS